MNYEETLEYLYNSAPLFQQVGKDAYKEGLDTTLKLDSFFGHPHQSFRTIHVAGTNGKGSCSHTLAALLQTAGYKVGLYTSPHLIDFRERIRVNGEPVSQEFVVNFVEEYRKVFEPMHPSFFELATAMAFLYFKTKQVDVAVIEVGLGGRLDCTNIITPDLCLITNISFDHVQFLGDTLPKIAAEKAGIIKPGVPVVIGEATAETRRVFQQKADLVQAPIWFAEDHELIENTSRNEKGQWVYATKAFHTVVGELSGNCQLKNTNTLLCAIEQLQQKGYSFNEQHVKEAFAHVCELTGLMGRWQILQEHPLTICDTGHNVGGIQYIVEQLKSITCPTKHIVIGMVNDKDISSVLQMLPKDARYYFTQASVKRALPASNLKVLAEKACLQGNCYSSVAAAVQDAQAKAGKNDLIFIGGSTFIVADLLKKIG